MDRDQFIERHAAISMYECKCDPTSPRSSFAAIPDRREVIEKIRAKESELRGAGVKSLHLFGSVARGDATFDSDVDLAAELPPRKGRWNALADALIIAEGALERPVDCVTYPLNPRLAATASDDLVTIF